MINLLPYLTKETYKYLNEYTKYYVRKTLVYENTQYTAYNFMNDTLALSLSLKISASCILYLYTYLVIYVYIVESFFMFGAYLIRSKERNFTNVLLHRMLNTKIEKGVCMYYKNK